MNSVIDDQTVDPTERLYRRLAAEELSDMRISTKGDKTFYEVIRRSVRGFLVLEWSKNQNDLSSE